MDMRTLRAAALADTITLVTIWGLGVFLGLPSVPCLIAGAVLGAMAAALIILAAKRSEGFSPVDQTDHLRLDRDLSGETDSGRHDG